MKNKLLESIVWGSIALGSASGLGFLLGTKNTYQIIEINHYIIITPYIDNDKSDTLYKIIPYKNEEHKKDTLKI